jgi:thioredoxin reductase
MEWECIVIGAGPAGLSAALTLGRARRRVLVLDSGAPRNHAAHAMHGVLGHDGLDPAELRAKGTRELARYGIEVRAAQIKRARAIDGGFEIEGHEARSVILATGLLDDTPAIEGFGEIYGVSAHTCPYCDGWEHRDERIAVLAPPAAAAHLGRLLRQWSPDVVVLTGGEPMDEDEIAVPVIREPIERFISDRGRLTAIELSGREPLERDALFFNVAMRPRTRIAESVGCALDERGFVLVEDCLTTVDRVYAVGNCTDPMQNVPMAIADGARAGIAVNVRLLDDAPTSPPAPAATAQAR